MFLLLELGSNIVYVEEFLLLVRWVRTKVFIVHHSLIQARGDAVQDNVDKVMICHLSIDIISIKIVQVFLESTCLLEITDLVESPV